MLITSLAMAILIEWHRRVAAHTQERAGLARERGAPASGSGHLRLRRIHTALPGASAVVRCRPAGEPTVLNTAGGSVADRARAAHRLLRF